MQINHALVLVKAELGRALDKHRSFASGHEAYAVILEELDEMWDEVKAQKTYHHYAGPAAAEAVQVAAMAVRFLVELCGEGVEVEAFINGREKAKADR